MTTAPLLLVPLRFEAAAVRAGAPHAELERIGLGPSRATATRERVTRQRAAGRPLVLLGVCGALRGDLRPGTVVLGTSVGLLGSSTVLGLEDPEPTAVLLRAAGLTVRCEPIVSSPRLVTGAAERRRASDQGPVVDMESFWCAPLASRHPFVICRVVLDVPGQKVSSLVSPLAVGRAWRSLSRAARAIAPRPSDTLHDNPLLKVGEH